MKQLWQARSLSKDQPDLPEPATAADGQEAQQGRGGLLAAGGVLGGVLTSSCCIAPLVLVTLGISGAWIGNLTALDPYKPYFLVVTAIFLAGGFWHVYFRPRNACAEGSYCARPASAKLTKSALWLGTVLAVLAGTVNYWAPLLY